MAICKPDPAVVIALTGTELPVPVVQSFIDDAALIAEKCLAALSCDRQTAMLKWLTAHLIASAGDESGEIRTSEKLGDATDSFARATLGEGLAGTFYGQQALLLDPNACLKKIGKSRATIEVV